MTQPSNTQRPFTGRDMFIIMLLFFGTIIAVNLTMAVYATTSWTGLVVKNSYVASQEFNKKMSEKLEQASLNLKPILTIKPGLVSYRLVDKTGAAITLNDVIVKFRRPVYESEDMELKLVSDSRQEFQSKTDIRDGIWIVETNADFGGKQPYTNTHRVVIKKGLAQ